MASQTKTFRDGALEVTVTEFGARQKSKLLARLGRVIAPALSKAPTEITDQTDVRDVAPSLVAFFESLDDAAQDSIIVEVMKLSMGTLGGQALELGNLVHFDRAVGSDMGLMYRLLWFALEVNFGDFSAGLKSSALGKVLQAAVANVASPST
jgi:hypothetical protein